MSVPAMCEHGNVPMDCVECYKKAMAKRLAINATQRVVRRDY